MHEILELENNVVVDLPYLSSVDTSTFCACCGTPLDSTSPRYPWKMKIPKAKSLNLQRDLKFVLCPNCFNLSKYKNVSSAIVLTSFITPILAFYILGILSLFIGPLISSEEYTISADILFIIGTAFLALAAYSIAYFKFRNKVNRPLRITMTVILFFLIYYAGFFTFFVTGFGITIFVWTVSQISVIPASINPILFLSALLVFDVYMAWAVFGLITVLIRNKFYNKKFKKVLRLYAYNPNIPNLLESEISTINKCIKNFELVRARLYSPNEKDSRYFFISSSSKAKNERTAPHIVYLFPNPQVLNKQYVSLEITNPLALYHFSNINVSTVSNKISLFKMTTIFTTDYELIRKIEHEKIIEKDLAQKISPQQQASSDIKHDPLSLPPTMPYLGTAYSDLSYSVSPIINTEESLYLKSDAMLKKEFKSKFMRILLIAFVALMAWASIFVYIPSVPLSGIAKFIVGGLLGINGESTLFYIVVLAIILLLAGLVALEAYTPNALGITISFAIGTFMGLGAFYPQYDPKTDEYYISIYYGVFAIMMLLCNGYLLKRYRHKSTSNYILLLISSFLGITVGVGLLYGFQSSLNIAGLAFLTILEIILFTILGIIVAILFYGWFYGFKNVALFIFGLLVLTVLSFGILYPVSLFFSSFSVVQLYSNPGSLFMNLATFLMFLQFFLLHVKVPKGEIFANTIVSLIEDTKPTPALVIQPLKPFVILFHPYIKKYWEQVLPTLNIEQYRKTRDFKNITKEEKNAFINVLTQNTNVVFLPTRWLIMHKEDGMIVLRTIFPGKKRFVTVELRGYNRIKGILLKTSS